MEISPKKILLVEDEDFIRDLYKRQLSLAGFKTDAFGTGNEGLDAALHNQYDLILLDIMLPGMNGLDILKRIRENEKTKETPVFLLTNLGQESAMKEGTALGATEYIIKAAVTPDQIVTMAKNLLSS